MIVWQSQPTKYMKKREEIALSFIKFLIKSFQINGSNLLSSEIFFNFNSVLGFMKTIANSARSLTLTHISEILKTVATHKQLNLEHLAINPAFTLKGIPFLKLNFDKKKTKLIPSQAYSKLTFNDVLSAVVEHKAYGHQTIPRICELHICRFLFQCLTGLRSINTFSLATNSYVKKKKCNKCPNNVFYQPCNILDEDCFHRLVILETKSTSAELPILPQIVCCYNRLKKHDTLKISEAQLEYSQFLKAKFNIKPHSCRQVLVNFFNLNMECNNTGNWANSRTIRKFYARPNLKYIMAYNLLFQHTL